MTALIVILLWALAAVYGPVTVRRCAPGEAAELDRAAIDVVAVER